MYMQLIRGDNGYTSPACCTRARASADSIYCISRVESMVGQNKLTKLKAAYGKDPNINENYCHFEHIGKLFYPLTIEK